MPTFEVTSPEGKKYQVNAPDGATEQDAIAYVQKNFGAPSATVNSSPVKIGADSFPDTLRDVVSNTDWGTRNIAGAGTALSDLWEGAKQFVGKGDAQQIEANKVMSSEAPVGALAGNVGLAAVPFGLAGNGLRAAGAVGAGLGALQPVQGEQTLNNVATGKAINTGVGAISSVAGQAIANKVSNALSNKLSSLATKKAQNAIIDSTLTDSVSAGYKVPPSMMPTSGVIPRILEGVSGKYKTNQLAGINNQQVTNALARKAVGLADDAPLTSEAMQAIRNTAYKAGYAPVEQVGTIPTDAKYIDDLSRIVEKYRGAARSFPGAADDSVLNSIMGNLAGGSPGKTILVDGYGNIVKDIQPPAAPKLRSLLAELKQHGGINPSTVPDIGVDKVHQNYPGLLRKDGGKDMDSVVEWMTQNGWLRDSDVAMAEAADVGGSHELARDMLRGALNREDIIHPADGDAFSAYLNLNKQLEDAGIRQVKIPAVDPKVTGGINVSQFDAGDALKMTQILRDEANAAYRAGDKAVGSAKKQAAKAIEDQIERNLFAQGQNGSGLLKGFRDARTLMAKAHTVEDAIREGGGSVDAKALARRVQSGKPMTGELAKIGNFANNFRDVAGIPQSGHANPFTVLDIFSGGLGAGTMNPMVAALPVSRVAARYGILSGPAQRVMARPNYELGVTPRVIGGLLGKSPAGGTILGLEALGQ